MPGKILVTGGAGFIGSHTTISLIDAGFGPVIVDNFSNSESWIPERIAEITGVSVPVHAVDCCDVGALDGVFAAEGPFDGVIHFAALKAVGDSVARPIDYYQNNIDSLIGLLRVMLAQGCKNLVFSSSCTVYGQPEVLPVTESAPILPAQSPYGYTKQVCESLIADSLKAGLALSAAVLRYFNPIGAHPSGRLGELPLGKPDNLVPFITQTAAGLREKLTVFGDDYDTADGSCIRDYIHVMDLAMAHVRALEWLQKQDAAGAQAILNVGTGSGVSVLEAIAAFEKASGKKLAFEIGPRRPGDVEQVFADPSLAQEVLDWRAEKSLEEAMGDAWRWQMGLGAD